MVGWELSVFEVSKGRFFEEFPKFHGSDPSSGRLPIPHFGRVIPFTHILPTSTGNCTIYKSLHGADGGNGRVPEHTNCSSVTLLAQENSLGHQTLNLWPERQGVLLMGGSSFLGVGLPLGKGPY